MPESCKQHGRGGERSPATAARASPEGTELPAPGSPRHTLPAPAAAALRAPCGAREEGRAPLPAAPTSGGLRGSGSVAVPVAAAVGPGEREEEKG